MLDLCGRGGGVCGRGAARKNGPYARPIGAELAGSGDVGKQMAGMATAVVCVTLAGTVCGDVCGLSVTELRSDIASSSKE